MIKLPILFIGQNWLGSCARSFKEALVRCNLRVEEICEHDYIPKWQSGAVKVCLRLLQSSLIKNFNSAVLKKFEQCSPKLIVVYKGTYIKSNTIKRMKDHGAAVVNIFPDVIPTSHGEILKKALGNYDLVVSTKVWHPQAWKSIFNYNNPCEFIAHGYDPIIHIRNPNQRRNSVADVVLVATYRDEYANLIIDLSKEPGMSALKMEIYGANWFPLRNQLPPTWKVFEAVHGYSYAETLLRGKICLSPVSSDIVIEKQKYPGDVDSSRTYEIPATGSCFIHKRTDYVHTIFKEGEEVLLYSSSDELANHIRRLLADSNLYDEMRISAHKRCVPRDSLDNRAKEFIKLLYDYGYF